MLTYLLRWIVAGLRLCLEAWLSPRVGRSGGGTAGIARLPANLGAHLGLDGLRLLHLANTAVVFRPLCRVVLPSRSS